MSGWSILYNDLSEVQFADLLGLDEKLADDIILTAKNHSDSDNEDSVYSRFSCVCAHIVGNNSVQFNCEGKLLSEEEIVIEEQLGLTVQELDRWVQSTIGTSVFDISCLTPAQQDWVRGCSGATGEWGLDMTESPYAHVDDEDAWDPSAPVSNPSQSGPVA